MTTIGSLSKDDGDGNKNGKEAMGLYYSQTTLHAHQAQCLHFPYLSPWYFLSWLLIVSFAFLMSVPVVFSRKWTSHAGVLKMPHVSRNIINSLLCWSVTLILFIQTRNSSLWKVGACQKSEQAGRMGNVEKFSRVFANYYPAYYIGADWSDWTVPTLWNFLHENVL